MMLKQNRRFAVLPLLLGCLVNYQAYAGVPPQKPADTQQPKAVAANPSEAKTATQPAASVKTATTAAPAAAEKPAAESHTVITAKPVEKPAGKTPESVPAPAKAADTQHQAATGVTVTEAATAPAKLQSLSIVESILSFLLGTVFVLVLFKGNLFKHHD